MGFIVPSANTVMEPALSRYLPAKGTVHTARMLLEGGGVTVEAKERMLDEYLPKAIQETSTDTSPDQGRLG